jgi:hypothetical protein
MHGARRHAIAERPLMGGNQTLRSKRAEIGTLDPLIRRRRDATWSRTLYATDGEATFRADRPRVVLARRQVEAQPRWNGGSSGPPNLTIRRGTLGRLDSLACQRSWGVTGRDIPVRFFTKCRSQRGTRHRRPRRRTAVAPPSPPSARYRRGTRRGTRHRRPARYPAPPSTAVPPSARGELQGRAPRYNETWSRTRSDPIGTFGGRAARPVDAGQRDRGTSRVPGTRPGPCWVYGM